MPGRLDDTQWVDDVIWWQVYPLGFVGAERAAADGPPASHPEHRLPRIERWLDYAIEMGASGLALGPVFSSESHGYDTVDHLRIDPRLGDDGDFDALVRAAHGRGLRVMLDGVFNHVGTGHPAFRAVLEQGPSAPTASWFRLRWPCSIEEWRPGVTPTFDVFEGHGHLVALDHAAPEVARMVGDVMVHWLDRGADAWRLDAAYAVPTSFWAPVLERVRDAHPGAYVMGEVIHGDYAAFVAESGMDSVTQYELWKALWSGLNDGNFFELAWALDRHSKFLDTFVPLTFVGNHDVTRIATQLTDVRHLPHALAVLMTVGGTPSVYYGDEQAYRGLKEERHGGDDAIRPEFPSDPSGLAAYGWETYRLHQQLIGLRRRNRWLHRARTRTIHLANEQLVYETVAGRDLLLVALNLADAPARLPAPHAAGVLAGTTAVAVSGYGEDAAVDVPGHGWAVLSRG